MLSAKWRPFCSEEDELMTPNGSLVQAWWRHRMETFSALLALCVRGNSPVTGEFPSQRPVTRTLICAWIDDWVNNRDAGDLRRHRAHYDVIVMICSLPRPYSCMAHRIPTTGLAYIITIRTMLWDIITQYLCLTLILMWTSALNNS